LAKVQLLLVLPCKLVSDEVKARFPIRDEWHHSVSSLSFQTQEAQQNKLSKSFANLVDFITLRLDSYNMR